MSVTPQIRRQASMFVSGCKEIEEVRNRFNPAQARLIPPHLTLCREDEVSDWSELANRIAKLSPIALAVEFGKPERDGNFVYLPILSGEDQFDTLRYQLLCNVNQSGLDDNHRLSDPVRSGDFMPRKQLPHLTLIHPRNGECTDSVYEEICDRIKPFRHLLTEIVIIEQTDGGPWSVVSFR